jgi:hypothetical protein
MMSVAPRRCWFRFSLRTMFAGMTLLACVAGWFGWNVQKVRERERMLSLLIERNATMIGWMPRDQRQPRVWRWLGARELGNLNVITMPVKDFTEQEFQQAQALFPEASVWRGNGN